MAWIQKQRTGYLVRWREDTGRVVSERRRTFDEARTLKAEVETALAKGTYVDKDVRKQTFETYATQVIESSLELRNATREHYRTTLRRHLIPRLGEVSMGELTAPRVRAALADMQQQGVGVHAIQHALRTLSKVVTQAMTDGVLHRNPLAGVKPPRAERREIVILTPQQVTAVAEAIRPKYRLAVYLAAYGQLRIGEIGGLRKDDIDYERRVIHVRRSVSTHGSKVEVGPPKSKASRRTVALPAWLMGEILEHQLHLEFNDSEGYLFRAETELIHHSTMWPIWREALAAAGFSEPLPRFHDLRHTGVALLIQQGAHPKMIQSRVGHTSITMTMDVYGHLFPGTDEELARGLEAFAPQEAKVVELR
jgi:integrase